MSNIEEFRKELQELKRRLGIKLIPTDKGLTIIDEQTGEMKIEKLCSWTSCMPVVQEYKEVV